MACLRFPRRLFKVSWSLMINDHSFWRRKQTWQLSQLPNATLLPLFGAGRMHGIERFSRTGFQCTCHAILIQPLIILWIDFCQTIAFTQRNRAVLWFSGLKVINASWFMMSASPRRGAFQSLILPHAYYSPKGGNVAS